MIAIPIKSKAYGEKLFFIDGEDFKIISEYKWSLCRGSKNGNLYVVRGKYDKINKKIKSIKLHRFILDCPSGLEVDHIDGNTLNNCRSNLRICKTKENGRNRKKCFKKTSSIYKGVYFNKPCGKFIASIRFNKKFIYLGLFNTEEEAAKVYNEAAIKYHGEFANLNIIGDKYEKSF